MSAIEPGAFQTDYITRSMHQADNIEDDPPLRLLLGRDVRHAFREKTAAWTTTVDEWEPVTVAMNFD